MRKSVYKTHIEGVFLFDLDFVSDHRGSLIELFRSDCLEASNLPLMAYASYTLPWVSRGPHEHRDQSDLFCFFGPGDFELVLWERRPGGAYEERHFVGESHPLAVIVPPGIVHAYRNISDKTGLVFNAPNKLFAGPGKCYPVDETRHEDVGSEFKL